jgi:hypothetical protein
MKVILNLPGKTEIPLKISKRMCSLTQDKIVK